MDEAMLFPDCCLLLAIGYYKCLHTHSFNFLQLRNGFAIYFVIYFAIYFIF